jgi:hypothetical protein
MSEVKTVTLENKIEKLENDVKELHTELSIALEFYGEVYELINELNQILKTRQLQGDRQDLKELEGFSLLKHQKEDVSSTSRESVLESKLKKTVNLIFEDYKTQGQKQSE